MNLLPAGCNDVYSIPITENDRIFEIMYARLIQDLYGERNVRRVEEICYGRIYNLLCAFKKQQRS